MAHLDNELFKNLLALNDKLEELKLQRGSGIKEPPTLPEGKTKDALIFYLPFYHLPRNALNKTLLFMVTKGYEG